MTASTNLGRVSMIPKGIWNAQSAYSKLNVVTIAGSSYLAVQDVPVGTSVSNTTYWQLIAEKGTSGGVGQLADEFSANNSYAVGDYCSYNQDIYRFINQHSGAWDVADVVLVSIANELKGKITEAEATALIESATVAEAEKLETERTISVDLASSTPASFDGSANVTAGVTGILPVANGGTGNTEGKASALTTAREILTDLASTNADEFDGSADVTPGVTGILPIANGGTGNANGTVAKLTTARTIRTNLGSTSTASFDGSADVTPGVTGILPIANGGTGGTDSTWKSLTNSSVFVGTIYYRKIGAFCEVSANDLTLVNELTSASGISLVTLPSGYRPSKVIATNSASTYELFTIVMYDTGLIKFFKHRSVAMPITQNFNLHEFFLCV